MTNILISGVTGFIGSHLAQHLAKDKNNTIYGLHRSIKHESVFNALNLNEKENINLIYGDINNFNTVNEAIVQYDIDNIYHLAAKVIVQDAAKTPTTTINTNVFGTLNILESVRLMKKLENKEIPTFVNSSDKSYGISEKLPYTEDLPLDGLDVYSASKACTDILSRSYAYTYNLPIIIGRPSNTYGLDFNWSRIVPSLAKSFIFPSEKYPLILNKGSYHYKREYTYVKDTVKAMELLMKNVDKVRGKAYNISSNCIHTTEEVVKLFSELTNNVNKQLTFKEKETTFKEIPEQYLDIKKLESVINWKPKYNLEDGLKETINLYKNYFSPSYLIHSADIETCKQKFC